jgi:DNA polymerase (family 10)
MPASVPHHERAVDRDTNLVIARLFEEIAQSLEIAGEQGHRLRAYRRAARSLAGAAQPVEELAAEGRLREIPGIGAAMAALINEYVRSGSIGTHQRLTSEFPPGLAPLLRARGFGPAGVQALFTATGATTLDEVEQAGRDGRLARAIGPRRSEDLLAQMPSLRNPIRSLRLKSAWETAQLVVGLLRDHRRGPARIEVAGAARRMCEMIENGLDLVAIPSQSASDLLDLLERLPPVVRVAQRDEHSAAVRLYDGVQVRVHLTTPHDWGAALVKHTGSAAHLARLGTDLHGTTEEEVYAREGLPWIAPELREDSGEVEAARDGTLPRLIEEGDLRGDMHCHTNETDGVATLEDMALAAKARGYAYMALTDHSRSLAITNGLSLERLEEARRLVQNLNQRLAPFVILLGTEMDILEDGSLDYPDDTLASLDYVSASVHSRFKQAEPAMTARILRAVSHPLVHTLNHPHGRLLGIRPAYAVDMPRVIGQAAAVGCAMEVSADPARMDLDGGWARRVRAAGGRCTISSDAHSTLDFDNIWLAIGSARRGWLEARHVLNTRPLAELRELLRDRTRKAL